MKRDEAVAASTTPAMILALMRSDDGSQKKEPLTYTVDRYKKYLEKLTKATMEVANAGKEDTDA